METNTTTNPTQNNTQTVEKTSKTKISTKTKVLLGSASTLALLLVTTGGVFAATKAESTNALLTRVAAILGVDSSKLTDAVKQAKKEEVVQDVKDGKLTQDQADKINTNIDNGNLELGRNGFGKMGGRGMMIDHEALTTFLGLTKEELMQKQQSNTTLLDIAKAQGKTEEQLKTFLSEQFDTNLKKEVTDGKITQEQADQMAKNKDEFISREITQTRPQGGRPGNMQGRPGTEMNQNSTPIQGETSTNNL